LQLLSTKAVGLRRHAISLDRVAKRPRKRAILDLSFDEIVLRAFLHGFGGQSLVFQAGQHDERDARSRGVRPAYRAETMPL